MLVKEKTWPKIPFCLLYSIYAKSISRQKNPSTINYLRDIGQKPLNHQVLTGNPLTIKYLRWFSLHRQPQNIGYAYIMNHNLFSYVPFCETRKHHQKQPKSANILMIVRKLPITGFLSRKDGWSLVLEQNPVTIPVQPRQKTSAPWKNLTGFITQKNAYPTVQ